jgi:hypothetical protein
MPEWEAVLDVVRDEDLVGGVVAPEREAGHIPERFRFDVDDHTGHLVGDAFRALLRAFIGGARAQG